MTDLLEAGGPPTEPRRLHLTPTEWALLRHAAPALVLAPPFDRVPRPRDLAADLRDRALARLADAGVIEPGTRPGDDTPVVLHDAVATSLLCHADPVLRVHLDVRQAGRVSLARYAVGQGLGPGLLSGLVWRPQLDDDLHVTADGSVVLLTGRIDHLVDDAVGLLDGPASPDPWDPVEVDTVRAAALVAMAGDALQGGQPAGDPPAGGPLDGDLPTPLDRFVGGLPGTCVLRLEAAGHPPAQVTWLFDGSGWWQPTPVGADRLRLEAVGLDDLARLLTAAIARRLAGDVSGEARPA